jgi:DNA-binding transcriptional MerR regulator
MNSNYKIAFNTQFVSSLTGASISQLNNWDKMDLVSPSILKSEGKGTIRLYSYEDIVEAKTVIFLKRHKHSIKLIKQAIDFIKQNFPYNRPLKDLALLANKEHIMFTEGNINSFYSVWISANKSGQLLMPFIVPIGGIISDIDKTIEHYNKRIKSAEQQEKDGTLIPFEEIEEKYFGISNKTNKRSKRSKRRRSA